MQIMSDEDSIRSFIKARRNELQVSRHTLHEAAYVGRTTITSFELGQSSITVSNFMRICQSLGIEVSLRVKEGL